MLLALHLRVLEYVGHLLGVARVRLRDHRRQHQHLRGEGGGGDGNKRKGADRGDIGKRRHFGLRQRGLMSLAVFPVCGLASSCE